MRQQLTSEFWNRQDQLICSALVASLSSEVVPLVLSADTSFDVWTTLHNTYARPSRARLLGLNESLSQATKGTQSMSSYLQHIKQLVTTLNSAGATLTMDDITLHVIHGLSPEYRGICDSLRTRDSPITFDELHEKLCDYEAYLYRQNAASSMPITANFVAKSNSNNSRNNKNNRQSTFQNQNVSGHRNNQAMNSRQSNKQSSQVICQYCDKPGHVLSTSANFVSSSTGSADWLVDSGASHHVTSDLQNLSLNTDYDGDDVMIGDAPLMVTHSVNRSSPCCLTSPSNDYSSNELMGISSGHGSSPSCINSSLMSIPPVVSSFLPATVQITSQWQTESSNAPSSTPGNITTSQIPQSKPVPLSHSMITRSKNNIHKPANKLCLSTQITNKSPLVHPSTSSHKPEPKNISQALKNLDWKSAMMEEYNALKQQGTWTLVPRFESQNLNGCKWIFRVKQNSDGTLNKYKARLVSEGFTQRPGIDYIETFSPVPKHITVRVILSLDVSKDWNLCQLGVNNAFLHGHLTEDVYMAQPQGFVDSTRPDYVCKLHKALYGLKQAPRAWYSELRDYLLSLDFAVCQSDHCLFIYSKLDVIIYLVVYVDDLIVTGNNQKAIDIFIAKLGKRFSIKDLGQLAYFLGVQRASMSGAKPVSTPLATTNNLDLEDSAHLSDSKDYQILVGCLQYLALTRPDIALATNRLAQFSHRPTTNHFVALKRVIRYLAGTMDKCSKKQRTVARSSTEAEYRSAASTAAELCWVQNLLKEISLSLSGPPVIHCDNLGGTYLSTNPVFHSRMKHLEIEYHFVRSMVQRGQLRVAHISIKDQLADLLTKPLSRHDFERFLSKIGVSDRPPS
ncbi:hypothetical protein KY285_035522 [Solanum tuberosum]|nr:hypothetical protein KY285_035522 [Solanum tuberosum]